MDKKEDKFMEKKEDKFLEEFLSKWIIICINGPIIYTLLKLLYCIFDRIIIKNQVVSFQTVLLCIGCLVFGKCIIFSFVPQIVGFIMKTDYKENEHKREVKDMLKISDYTNTVREEIEGSSELRKMIQRNLDKMNEVIGDIDMSEKQKKTWLWLAGYEESTIDNILDVIKQKRR